MAFWRFGAQRRDKALFDAITAGDVEAVRAALRAGANPNARADLLDAKQITPLMLAAWECEPDIGIVLLKAGAAVSDRDDGGRTALHRASWRGDLAMITLLHSAGGDLNAVDSAGNRCKEYADAEGQVRAVRLIDWLDAGFPIEKFGD